MQRGVRLRVTLAAQGEVLARRLQDLVVVAGRAEQPALKTIKSIKNACARTRIELAAAVCV